MILKKIINLFLIISLFVLIFPLISSAQTALDSSFLDLEMMPANPEPMQGIKLTLKSLSYDLDRAKISWFVNGEEKRTDIGIKEFNTQAGKNGQKMTIKVLVETGTGEKKGIEAFFIPSIVDLITEARSYVPPFYKGRALNSKQGTVLITALPELLTSSGQRIPAQNIIYSWKVDGVVDQGASGRGKNVLQLTGTIPVLDSIVLLNASSPENNIYVSKQIKITNIDPKIIFYENNPLYGIMFNRAIKNTVKMVADELKVNAFPYFTSVGYTQNPDLVYTWSINGQTSENLDEDNSAMLFKQVSAGGGVVSVDLKVENLARIFQFTDNSFKINFEKQ